MYSRRSILIGLMATAALPACAGAPETSLRPQARPLRGAAKIKANHTSTPLKEIIAGAGLSGTSSVVVADAATGRVLEAFNPTTDLPPASVTKAVTALYALHNLGGSYRHTTRLIATGSVSGDTLRGDLILAVVVDLRVGLHPSFDAGADAVARIVVAVAWRVSERQSLASGAA